MDRPTKSECLDTFAPIQQYDNNCPEVYTEHYFTDNESNQTFEEESSGEVIPILPPPQLLVPAAPEALQAPKLELHQE